MFIIATIDIFLPFKTIIKLKIDNFMKKLVFPIRPDTGRTWNIQLNFFKTISNTILMAKCFLKWIYKYRYIITIAINREASKLTVVTC